MKSSQQKLYDQKVKAAQQAYFAVQIRYRLRTPRPRIKVAAPNTSSNVVDIQDVLVLSWDAIKNPRDPMVWVEVLGEAVKPAVMATSDVVVVVDGPYREEVALMRAIKDVQDTMPPSERRQLLNKWIEQKVWEAEHKPYIAPPRPL